MTDDLSTQQAAALLEYLQVMMQVHVAHFDVEKWEQLGVKERFQVSCRLRRCVGVEEIMSTLRETGLYREGVGI